MPCVFPAALRGVYDAQTQRYRSACCTCIVCGLCSTCLSYNPASWVPMGCLACITCHHCTASHACVACATLVAVLWLGVPLTGLLSAVVTLTWGGLPEPAGLFPLLPLVAFGAPARPLPWGVAVEGPFPLFGSACGQGCFPQPGLHQFGCRLCLGYFPALCMLADPDHRVAMCL